MAPLPKRSVAVYRCRSCGHYFNSKRYNHRRVNVSKGDRIRIVGTFACRGCRNILGRNNRRKKRENRKRRKARRRAPSRQR